ncbi:SBBP repeat-containing protein [Nostoc sp. UHCC 0702]|nr:SBBP repeat-containing protein [Nostoc sp. UHCC 0702]
MVDYARGLSLLSPGSDTLYTSQPLDTGGRFILGRDGSDTIALYDPAGNPAIPQSDAILADVLQGEFPGERILRNWSDTFVAGDWQKPYYVNPDPGNIGINEALFILNFQPDLDHVRLFGSAQDYQLVNIPNIGQILLWKGNNSTNTALNQDTSFLQQLANSPVLNFLKNQNLASNSNTVNQSISLPQPLASAKNSASQITTSYWEQKTVPDIVAILLDNAQLREQGFPSIPALSLEGDYFQYVGSTPPAPGENFGKIKQVGTATHDVTISPAVSVATDGAGNVFLSSSTTGSLAGTNAGASDAWVVKYNSKGEQVLAKQYGSAGEELVSRIATDQFGNFYLAGYSRGDFGAANPTGLTRAFVSKYNSDGEQQWIQQFGGFFDASFGLDVDDAGTVYISGIAGKLVPIDLENPTFLEDAFVAKYDTNGNQMFYKTFGSPAPGSQEAYAAASDHQGNIFAAGWTSGNIDPSLSGRIGTYDAWISKHDTNGNLEWIRQFGSKDYEFVWGLDTDSLGNVYASGWTLGDLGGKNAGSYDAWLAKYDPFGTLQWIQQFGTAGDDEGIGITIDELDNIFLIGYTDSNLGGTNKGSYDAWVARFDTSGNRLWTQQFGTPQLDFGTQLSSDHFGNLYVTGLTEGSLGKLNAGSVDAWLAKIEIDTGKIISFHTQPIPESTSSLGLLLPFCLAVIKRLCSNLSPGNLNVKTTTKCKGS